MLNRSYRYHMILLLIIFATGWLPSAPVQAQPPARYAAITPPPPQTLRLPPPVDPHLPSLTVQLAVAPDPLQVGDTASITLTITNAAPDPANDLVVELPAPAELRALPGSATLAGQNGWRWAMGRLDSHASTTLTATAHLERMPDGQALLLKAQASAQGLLQPVQVTGGTLVRPTSRGAAQASFTPGSASTLRSRDGRVTVQLPAQAHARRLALRHTALADKRAELIARRELVPPTMVGFKRGLDIFFLDAADDTGAEVHRFAAPLTIRVAYTPAQLQARGISEHDVALFWFNPDTRDWEALETTVDLATHTASATVDHFSAFALSDGSSPSDAFLPSIQGFQVGLFTGSAIYSYPIEVPSGPGGIKPSLALSYSSAATDGDAGLRPKQQASWVGKGWSLDTGAVARNKIKISASTTVEYFTLVLNGQSFDLMRGPALVANPSAGRPSDWSWYPTDESFIRVRAVHSGDSSATRGGFHSGLAYPRYTWQVWTKDGTRYEFSEDAWWGFEQCGGGEGDYAYMETYKWHLSRVVDPNNNTISYTYGRASQTEGETCFHVQGTVDADVWPETITWGGNLATGAPDRYRVQFMSFPRGSGAANDMEWDGADNQYGGSNAQPHSTRRLAAIQVFSMPGTAWELIRQYTLDNHHFDLYPDRPICTAGCNTATPTFEPDTAHPKLALHGIVEQASDGATAVPTTTLTYAPVGGQRVPPIADPANSTDYPSGAANRLVRVDNGQGGQIDFTYETIGAALDDSQFYNYHRVTSKTVRDGSGGGGCAGTSPATTCTWTYSYGTPNINSLGTTLGGKGTQANPNSAVLYYNKYANQFDNRAWLAHKPHKEFRGHPYVLETDPLGTQTEHWFYQGDVGCVPGSLDEAAGTCFQRLRDREFLKGREYQTCVRSAPLAAAPTSPCDRAAAGGALLQETLRTFSLYDRLVQLTDDPPTYTAVDHREAPLSGLWRAFVYESQTEQRSYDPTNRAMPPVVRATRSFYDPAYQFNAATPNTSTPSGVQYGNLTRVDEYLGPITAGAQPIRVTEHFYTARVDASTYIVDRAWATSVRDGLPGTGRLLALRQQFYDGNNTTVQALGSSGDVTRASSYLFDLPGPLTAQGLTLSGRDEVYTYDAYGNRLTVTTYSNPSTRQFDGMSWSIGQPGGANPSLRTATTEYDPVFHVFPTKTTSVAVNGKALIEQADYDYRMGTLIKVVGPNGNAAAVDCRQPSFSIPAGEEITCAQYDMFGRLRALFKPGDSSSAPSVRATYYDHERPFRYLVEAFSGTGDVRRVQKFYDGIGKLIQIKSESLDDTQNIVEDTVYDQLGRAVKQSQARYVTEAQPATVPTSGYWTYTPPADDTAMRWTTTAYDALGRPVLTVAPDGTASGIRSEHRYGVVTGTVTLATAAGITTRSVPLAYDDVLDPNRHRTQTRSDAFGRLAEVHEIAGDCGYWSYACAGATTTPWEPYSTTRYGYNGSDQLVDVVDAAGSRSQMFFDSLGRKTRQIDPDLGAWRYVYDINGNMYQQTDAKGQVLWLSYDARDRLQAKRADGPSGPLLAVYNYDETAQLVTGQPRHGKGRRTSISSYTDGSVSATTRWAYDARGRKLREEHSVSGLSGTRVFDWTYDGADRVATLRYPSGEVLTYEYDAAWRAARVCSSLSGSPCYVSGAEYTALKQPAQRTLGNGLIQLWQYHDPTQRLARLQVGSSSAPGSVLDRQYAHDKGGNIATLDDQIAGETQTFGYDHRDRLTSASTASAGMRLAAGGSHSLARTGDGAVWAWGGNAYGQLGDGGTSARSAPQPISGLPTVQTVVAAIDGSMALAADGTVWAWGYNYDGQVGNGSTTTTGCICQPTPVQVSGLTSATAIAAGRWHRLALTSDGAVWAWGGNAYGQLGDGSTTSRSAPVPVSGLTGVTAIAAFGGDHSLALKADGTVWAWGDNGRGQLGDGGTTSRSTPAIVPGLTGVVALAAGASHSLALRSDGTVWAWGANTEGQLGDGTRTDRRTPVLVSTLSGVTTLVAGSSHSLARTADGRLWAWGSNYYGQLGDGTRLTTRSTPILVGGLSGVQTMAAGSDHSLALDGAGALWGWGQNTYGELGDGSTSDRLTPTPASAMSGPGGSQATYTYSALGNLTSMPDLGSYTYGAAVGGCASGTPATKPHAVAQAGSITYTYDCNGNLLSGGGRILTWDRENRPASIAHVSGTYTYGYDADGERVRQHNGSVTTYYLGGGLWEEEGTGATTAYYTINGQPFALRSSTDGLTYLHSDHLGSVSVATHASGAVASEQRFGPWGQPRGGGSITQTSLNYTGQRRDLTGLLYYHARYYDPVLGRFISPDTIMPGLANPQALNRYSYANNNPVNHTDPTGHCIPGIGDCKLIGSISELNWHDSGQFFLGVAEGAATVVQGAVESANPLSAIESVAAVVRDPKGTVESIQRQASTVARGAEFLWNDPGGAAAVLNDNPREVGQVLGQAAATAALAKAGPKSNGAGPKGPKPCSFTPDTLVATADGLTPIGELDIGDPVLAYNEATGTTGVYTVTDVLIHTDPLLVHLTLDGEPIVTTPEHPFFVLLRGWVPAAELGIGDRVRNADGGYGSVQALAVEPRTVVMYNLTVATAHTFFVGEGRWLVHNMCGIEVPKRYSGRYTDGTKAYRTNVPRDPVTNIPEPIPGFDGPHSRLNFDAANPNRVYSAVEFDSYGNPVKRIDFAGRRGDPLPHEHIYDPVTKGFGGKEPIN